ncbi:galactose-1-phosphate uridylyltransferase [Frondihabitans australicus]|uniref:Galactose-1-phosphate uridylyltransferase n=1 Tax=Frondihabitans australicus TaxID=386892 RepID=A0A495IJW0_9MICO|nr:galactose-1-phosphate uridylyltransferase [Frondihabitans australicus]RKR75405.1 UDPglucose--hexose-1-phosphate uridylyltransferase [Frondihabitans australicus]
MPIAIRPTVLADGRELIYFDDADTALSPERKPDTRPLEARPETATMRQDVLTGEWVSIAAARQNRAQLPPAEFDPLAPQSPTNPSEIPDVYDVAVFENRSPSFGPLLAPAAPDAPHDLDDLAQLGLNRTRTSVGRCEVVCFSPETNGSLSQLPESRMRTVVEAWSQRTAALSELPGVQEVFPFENRGEAIGVTLHHPHGQIYAYPYVTPRTTSLLRSIDQYGPTLFADVLEHERTGPRVVLASESFTAFVPFAARWPVEIHLLPHRQVPDFAALTDDERDELAGVYRRLLRGVDALYDDPTPYIAAWHQAPVNVGRDTVRLNLQITSPRRAATKLKYLAGSEAAMGAWIGDLVPEQSAAAIREAVERA